MGLKMKHCGLNFFNHDKKYPYGKGKFELLDLEELAESELKTFEYFKQIAKITGIKTDDDKSLLANEYEKINSIKPQSVLFHYLNTNAKIKFYRNAKPLLFPFGLNLSQFQALENALTHQVSIIEGPPGTGKTQTILNIIANLLYRNQSIAVVSNNNTAIQNVLEKLEEYGLDYLCAMLGNKDNKDNFIANQQDKISKFNQIHKLNKAHFIQDKKDFTHIEREIVECNENLQEFFNLQNSIAQTKAFLTQLELEFAHFKKEIDDLILPKLRNLAKLESNDILYLKMQMQQSAKIGFFLKLKLVLWYGVGDFDFYKNQITTILSAFEYLFYESKRANLKRQLKQDCALFENLKQKDLLNKLKKLSTQILKAHLHKKYAKFENVEFSLKDLYMKTNQFVEQYPIVFSTTHSIVGSLNESFCFDYLICDEASQVDLTSAILALSMAKNVVIVGDTKQLPHIISRDKIPQIQRLNENYAILKHYNCLKYSFLSSLIEKFAHAPKVLLREHYRCRPKIIEFCNQRFYENQLIILNEDKEQKDALQITFTAIGNHARGKLNQREIDEIVQVILPQLRKNLKDCQIGIITPYNEQKRALQEVINSAEIQIDTVHKFQGREKEAIIISVVDNMQNEFVNDPHLLNVAITRAKQFLYVVLSSEFKKENGYLNDLIKYAQYHHFEIKQSAIKSIFDLLYRQNYEAMKRYLKGKKRISSYDSENIAFNAFNEILANKEFANMSLACFVPLSRLIKDKNTLNENELKYALNPQTHIDFVIFHKMDKMPLLAIEIDGYAFHNPLTNQAQAKRDKLKDVILAKNNFPLLRLSTVESNEKERLKQALKAILKQGQ